MEYIFRGGASRPSIYGESKSRETRIKQPKGEYKFGRRINRLQLESQIKPIFERGYKRLGRNQHYGRITIEKEVKEDGKKENGETKKVEKEISVRIDFSLNHSCFLYVTDEEDLEDAYRRIVDALLGR